MVCGCLVQLRKNTNLLKTRHCHSQRRGTTVLSRAGCVVVDNACDCTLVDAGAAPNASSLSKGTAPKKLIPDHCFAVCCPALIELTFRTPCASSIYTCLVPCALRRVPCAVCLGVSVCLCCISFVRGYFLHRAACVRGVWLSARCSLKKAHTCASNRCS